MKVWQIKETGRKNLHQEEQAIPAPGPNEVVLRVDAFSLNYRDKAIIDGTYPLPMPLPLIPGSDAAGEIVSVGSGVQSLAKGDRVITRLHVQWIDGKASYAATGATLGGPLPGVFAEYAVVSEEGVIKYPSYLTPEQASTLPIAALTAWVGLFKHGHLEAGDDVLVQGSGGVSVFALQLAKAAGNRVIALSRSKEKGEKLLKLGASEVVDTTKNPDWEGQVRELTGGKGADVIIEVIGGSSVQHSIAASAFEGHIAVIGFIDNMMATVAIPWMLGTNVTLQGVSVGSRSDFEALIKFLEKHRIEPIVEATYSFDELPQAFEHFDKSPFGKIVVKIG
jgi:NADPH:quinone reductase-like Zn-dependent oxidoreductase